MKIAYYLPSLQAPGGIERIVTFKANYFAEHFEGYDITIITSEQMGKAPHFPLSPKVKHIDLGVSFDLPYSQSIVSKVLKYPFRYYRFKQRLSNLLNELKPDITISTMRRELNFITKLKDGSLKIGEFHVSRYAYGAEALKRKSPIVNMIKKRWANRFVKNLSKLSRVIILTSEGAKDWPELTNISIIPNPISTPVEGKQTDILSHNAIAVGRYAPQKGFDMLIPAWSIVAQRHPDWKLHIYGEGDLKEKFTKLIDELQLNNNCLLHHTVSNIAEKYCMSSIFVLSSRYEGFGLVLAEAMSCGIPCVSFDCPHGPSDIIKDHEDGLLVEKENIKELADKICYLIENENVRIKMGHKARENVKRFLPENVMPQWKNLFESLTYSSNKTYLEVYGKSFDEISDDSIRKVKRQLKERQNDSPLVSVVLIAHNEERHLISCIWSLSENHCHFPIEIIAVNNNSTDKTEEVLKSLGVTYYNETKKGPGYARQCGLDHAKGKYHICIDADTLYPPHYIETHVKYLMNPKVACTFSLWSFMVDERHSRFGLWCYEGLRDIYLRLQAIQRPELCVRGMAFSFNTEIGRRFGFRTDIIRGEDGSLALAMKPYGKIVFITSRKARVLTSNGTLNSEGSLIDNIWIRVIKALKEITGLFIKKTAYKDKDSNLIK